MRMQDAPRHRFSENPCLRRWPFSFKRRIPKPERDNGCWRSARARERDRAPLGSRGAMNGIGVAGQSSPVGVRCWWPRARRYRAGQGPENRGGGAHISLQTEMPLVAAVRIEHVMHMTSGLPDYDGSKFSFETLVRNRDTDLRVQFESQITQPRCANQDSKI